ncbi:hypothetical protein DW773_09795 [Firmicutes bacterium AM29-6AC]|jgi:Mn-containing catalase|nr:hypothetical protein DWX47_05720 [Firmicutes bacterium AF19-2LB]RHT39134.1 hypothetical protein DW773_09795 [Firmicutes bacterium AM29-6AC]
MMGTIVHQLTQGLTKDEILAAGLDPYYVNHGLGVYPSSAAGVPFTAAYLQSKGDPITDLYEDMAAEGAFMKAQPFSSFPFRNKSVSPLPFSLHFF